MAPDQVVLFGLAALGAMLLLVRPVLVRGEPWWVAWPAPLGAVAVLAAFVAGFPLWLLVPALVVLGAGLAAQLWWARRRGRFLTDDVGALWRRLRGRPARRPGRHRARDVD